MYRFIAILCLYLVAANPLNATTQNISTDMDTLQGRWSLVSINGETVRPGIDSWFEIDGSMISGFDGCNTFGGDLSKSSSMRISQRGCEDNGFIFPLSVTSTLKQLSQSTIDGDILEIPLVDADGIALFVKL